jgi:hypothetical protein
MTTFWRGNFGVFPTIAQKMVGDPKEGKMDTIGYQIGPK